MKIVFAFDSFKGCMTANEACSTSKSTIHQVYPDAEVACIPLSDGGEGLVECIKQILPTKDVIIKAHGPLMEEIEASYAISLDGETAYMEMASTSGLSLVPENLRNPMNTTTYGVGEMIIDAAEQGCKHIFIGIGGSATCDGGKGMIEALRGKLPLGIDIQVACDVTNPLYGKNGAAYVFAPQKGATKEEVEILNNRLKAFAKETEKQGIAEHALCKYPGTGAAGGLGYGLMAYLDAKLCSGIETILKILDFEKVIADADCIVTGEGKSDNQTLMGKVPYGVLTKAQRYGISVHILSGQIEDEHLLLNAGFASVTSINRNCNKPLEVLMQKEVAIKNLQETIIDMSNIFTNKSYDRTHS